MNANTARLLAPLTLAALLGACASRPPAEPAIAASMASFEAARSAGAPEFAPAQLDEARGKIERARAQARAGNTVEAIRLAEQANADAQLARAMTGAERSRRSAQAVDASLRSLREELNRTPVAPPAAAPTSTPAR